MQQKGSSVVYVAKVWSLLFSRDLVVRQLFSLITELSVRQFLVVMFLYNWLSNVKNTAVSALGTVDIWMKFLSIIYWLEY